MRKFYKLSFFKRSDSGSRSMNIFLCSFWLLFYLLDPDPGSQSLADPMDPDSKH